MSSWNRIDRDIDRSHKHGLDYSQHSSQGLGPEPSSSQNKNSEYAHRFAALSVGLASVVSEHILSHPCIVLRRQCQVHNTSTKSHLIPISLFQTIYNLQRRQSVTSLWKGLGSSLMVKGITVASEAVIHEFTPLPKEINRHSTLKKMAQHVLLKGLALVVVTPFYAASLIETVQSEIASKTPGMFDCIFEGVARLASFKVGRLVPIWKLILPTVVFGVAHYIISSLTMHRVSCNMKAEIENRDGDEGGERTIYEVYYPELVATFSGNLLADTILYPFETVLHRLFLQGTRTIIDNTDTGFDVVPIGTKYSGVFDCFNTIYDEEGTSGFYKGFGALIIQYCIHIGILKLTRCILELLSSKKEPRSQSIQPVQTPSQSKHRPISFNSTGQHGGYGEPNLPRDRFNQGMF